MSQPLYDVAIVGYGPVGQTLAILLGQRGWKVGVFERQKAAYPMPRAVHFDHEAGRILQAASVSADLSVVALPGYTREWRNADGETLLRVGGRYMGLSGWPESNMFSQPELERLLDGRARACSSVKVNRGCDVVGIRSDDEIVRLQMADPHDRLREVKARYVVGCDGANSFVREHAQLPVTDLGDSYDWLVVDVVTHDPTIWEPLNWQLCDPARPTTVLSGGPGRRRWEFMRIPSDRIEDLNDERTAWRLLEAWDIGPDNAKLERHSVYSFRARWVERWRKGRLLVAGDAAHLMPPFAGQGMCAGLRDVVNLAWKLDLVLDGAASDALLDSYGSERLPNVKSFVDFSRRLGEVICVTNAEDAAKRDATMVAAAESERATLPPPVPALGPGILAADDPLAGRLFLQGRVTSGTAAGLFDDVVGRGWILLSLTCDPAAQLDADSAAFFESIGGLCVQLTAEGPVRDSQGAYADWFAEHGVAVVLQRPDFYIFGTSRFVSGASELVAQLRRALSS